MPPRYGRHYASAALRPFAEQLIDALQVRAGSVTCDVLCDGGTLSAQLAAAAGSGGTVVVTDVDAALVGAVARDLDGTGCAIRGAGSDGRSLAVASDSCDAVGSLFTLGFGEPAALFDEARRVARATGSVGVLLWDEEVPPAHEAVLAAALERIAGWRPPLLACIMPRVRPSPASVMRLHDVIRFDSVEHYWMAMVTERHLSDMSPLAGEIVAEVRAACSADLERYAGADGTLRIPVEALLLRG